jgi:hypothetical protein
VTRLGAAMRISTAMHEPAQAAGVAVEAPADGRSDPDFTMPASGGFRVAPNASAALVVGIFPFRAGRSWRSDLFRLASSRWPA